MMKRIAAFGIAALACTATATPAPKAGKNLEPLYTTDMTGSDLQFFNEAGEQDNLQSILDEMAATHAHSGPVKTFGEALLKDHAAETRELKKLAAAKRISLSAFTPQKTMTRALARLDGEKFSKTCMEDIIAIQKRQIAAYEKGSHSADAEIRHFAEKSLPGLNEHLLLAQKIVGIASAETLFKTRVPSLDGTPAVVVGSGSENSSPPPPGLEGSLELADGKLIAGWAYDSKQPNQPLTVEVYDGTSVVATVVAKEYRGDLKQGGKGDGKHFFMLPTPANFKDGKAHWIRVAVSTTHFELPGSPKSVIIPAPAQ